MLLCNGSNDFKVIMLVFCSAGIKGWTVIFIVCLGLKNYPLVIPLERFVPAEGAQISKKKKSCSSDFRE